ncbi:MAG: hypothetical protein IT349_21050 [Candidatus Eisenbacteria bacterium]|nr:hypothetical protein [Candidatus Eisenbacteria bacterium]
MKLIAPLVLAGISCAAPVLAGPHAGGSLILHVNSDVVYTTDAESWCGSSGITSCEDAVTQATASPDSIRVFFALAAFSEWSTPRLRGITFGINYDSTAVAILATGTCADFEISTPTWPSPNSGTALTWYQPQTTHLTEVCWFAGYAYDESTPSSVALQAHPVQGGQFADDSVPAALDDISGYGVLGFGMPGMIPGCGAGEWGGGGTGNAPDGGGGRRRWWTIRPSGPEDSGGPHGHQA